MRYASIPLEVLHSAAFRGAEPVDRATWMCLLAYCYEQETGGRVPSCRAWGDRRWQQLIAVTKDEIDRCAEGLWHFDGEDLVVEHYDHAYVEHVRGTGRKGSAGGSATSEAKTAAARTNGSKGGRPAIVPRETLPKGTNFDSKPNGNPTDNPTDNPTNNPPETERNRTKPNLDGYDGRTDKTPTPQPPATAGGGQPGGGGGDQPPRVPTKAENTAALEKLLHRLVCATGPIATPKWAGVAMQGKASGLREALECVEWLVKHARAQGVIVEYAGDVMPYLPQWEDHRRAKRRAVAGARNEDLAQVAP
jgi:hypothetical protein